MEYELVPVRANRAISSLSHFTGASLAALPQVTEPTAHPPLHTVGSKGLLTVTWQLVTGPSPAIEYRYRVPSGLLGNIYVLYAFESRNGFADPQTHQLQEHGKRIGTYSDDEGFDVKRLSPGETFYSFILWRTHLPMPGDLLACLFSGNRYPVRPLGDVVQFSVSVPSLTVATEQVKSVTAHVRANTDYERAVKEYRAETGQDVQEDPVEAYRRQVKVDLDKKQASRETITEHFDAQRRRLNMDPTLTAEAREDLLRRLKQQEEAELHSRSVY